jgi:hypothetical protein
VTAGADKTINVSIDDFHPDEWRAATSKRYYEKNLLDPTATTGGTFPHLAEHSGLNYLLNRGATELTTVYTVGEGACQDSATFSLILEPSVNL